MKTYLVIAAVLSGMIYVTANLVEAAEGDLQPWSQATPENLEPVEEPTCGKYVNIGVNYGDKTCDEQIFADIENDAANGGSE